MTTLIASAGQALALHAETERTVLPNGLTLLVRRDRSAPVVSIVTYVKAGYFDEMDEQVGMAHVVEHMFFKGTSTRGVGAIAREIRANGGHVNAHTAYDHTSYYTVLPASSFVSGLEIQFDAYAGSVIEAGELARELEVIIQEVKRKRDTPSAVTIESLYALLYDRHRIRRWRMGDELALRQFTREQIMAFYRRWYKPGNTIVAVVGDVDPDDVYREVLLRHGTLGDDEEVAGAPGPQERSLPGMRCRWLSGDVVQSQLAIGWRTPSLMHYDAPTLELSGVLLGTGRASRLYRTLCERQLATSVSAWNYATGETGVFVMHAEVPPQRTRDAASAIWRELQSLHADGVRPVEVVRAQHILESRWLRRLESMDGQAQYLAVWEARGGISAAARHYDALLSLDAAAVGEAVRRHLVPDQIGIVSYRPDGYDPIARSVDELRDMLSRVRAAGSEIMVTPSVGVPAMTDTVVHATGPTKGEMSAGVVREQSMSGAAAAVGIASLVEGGVHVYRTALGVPILIHRRSGAPLVHVGVFVRGGAVLDPIAREGLACLTTHTMLKGTASRSGVQVAEATEMLGSGIRVSAGLESVGWTMSVPARYLPQALELLGDVVQHPVFPADGVETERELALNEVARMRDDMYRWPIRLASGAAYGDHPYARPVRGSETSLAALEREDVRAWHSSHVLRGPSAVSVVGDIDPAEAARLCRDHLGEIEHGAAGHLSPVPWPRARRFASDSRSKQQSALALLFPGPSRTEPARHAARVLAAIAGGLGGRLFEQLRGVQSLAYTVRVFPVERSAGGAFLLYIATSPERVDEARDGLMSELARFREQEPSDEEMWRARSYLMGTHAIAQQSGRAVLESIVDAWLFGEGLNERTDEDDRIARVTGSDVRRLAECYLRPGLEAEGLVNGTARVLSTA